VAFKSTDFKSHLSIFEKIFTVKFIKSIEELKKVANFDDRNSCTEFYIRLNGYARSSKRIFYYPSTNTFDIYNAIDDLFQDDLTEEQLRNETMIVEAIEKGAFYQYEF